MEEVTAKYFVLFNDYKKQFESNYGTLMYNQRKLLEKELETKYLKPIIDLKEEVDQLNFKYITIPERLNLGLNSFEYSVDRLSKSYTDIDVTRDFQNALADAYKLGMTIN